MLECDYCDSRFTVEQIEEIYKKKKEKAVGRSDKTGEQAENAAQTERTDWTESTDGTGNNDQTESADRYADNSWGEDFGSMRAYNCPSCGAQLMCEASTAATSCPYCGNPSIVPGQFSGILKPDYVIPFGLNKDAAMAALKKHYKKKFFLPKAFSANNQIEKIQGVYVPFWLYDTTAFADCHFRATNVHTHREGDYKIVRTDIYSVDRSGTVRFSGVPADASTRMPDDIMDSIEPFDYSGIRPFAMAYLPGYLADRFDVTSGQDAERIERRCVKTAEDIMRGDVRGYQNVTSSDSHVDVQRESVSYAMLPVWMIHTKWRGQDYLFAMNGQTGKFTGNLPVSKGKFWGICAGLAAVIGAAAYLLGIGDFFWMVFFA